MSSTARGGKRSPADFYATPPWPVHRFLERCALPGGPWLERAAGDGAIIKAVNECDPYHKTVRWTAIEKRSSCKEALVEAAPAEIIIADFLTFDARAFPCPPRERRPFNVCISNDPFSLAMDFIEKSLTLARYSIHLLRLNFLGTEDRNEFFKNNMPDIYVIPDRVSFAKSISCMKNKKGCTFAKIVSLHARIPPACPLCGSKLRVSTTDSIEYAWFVWGPERGRKAGQIHVLDHTPLEERKG